MKRGPSAIPVPAGTKVGRLELQKGVSRRRAKGRWRCTVCGAKRRYSFCALSICVKKGHMTEGCTNCAKLLDIRRGRYPTPIKRGEQFGRLVALRSQKTISEGRMRWRCVICGNVTKKNPCDINSDIARGGCGCRACDKAEGHKKAVTHSIQKKRDKQKQELQSKHKFDSTPYTGVVAWKLPFMDRNKIFRGPISYQSEDDPGFENACRVIEDYSSDVPF